MSENLSLLVGLKNNLSYSKSFYFTTRALYPDVEIVFTSYGSTDQTDEWLQSINDKNLIYFHSSESKTFADTYNKCTQLATKKYVVFAHNDMVLTPCFLENIEKHVSENHVINYTTIEPPIFSDNMRPGKIVKDFGPDPDNLMLDALYSFSKEIQQINEGLLRPEEDVSFFLCAEKALLLSIGGLDPLFNPMFCEDDDLVLRLKLSGAKFFTCLDAICYHFVSKTSRFSKEYEKLTTQIEANSNRNFIRKWGFRNTSAFKKKLNIGLIVKNGDASVLARLEPLSTNIYIDCEIKTYIEKEQPKTLFDLSSRIKPLNSIKGNDILVVVDAKNLNERYYDRILRLNEVIYNNFYSPLSFWKKLLGYSKSNFKWKIFSVTINKMVTHESEQIHLKSYRNVV